MATGGNSTELSLFTKCSKCNQTYKDPRILHCLHSFCLTCLQRELRSRTRIKCSTCGVTYSLTSGQLTLLPVNHFIKNICSILEISEKCKKSANCDYCLKADDAKVNATRYCFECDSKLCDTCEKRFHSVNKTTSKHSVADVGSFTNEDEIKKTLRTYVLKCDIHKDQPAELYCFDDKKLICQICLAEDHTKHRCLGIDKTGETFRKKIKTEEDKIRLHKEKAMKMLSKSRTAQQQYKTKVNDVTAAINKHTDELIATIDKQSKDLLIQVNKTKNDTMKLYEKQDMVMQKIITVIEELIQVNKQLLNVGSDCIVTEWKERVKNNCKEIIQIQVEDLVPDFDCFFVPTDLTSFTSAATNYEYICDYIQVREMKETFEEVVETPTDKDFTEVCRSVQPRELTAVRQEGTKSEKTVDVQFLSSFNVEHRLTGITKLHSLLYVVKYKSPVISVYDVEKLNKQQPDILLEELNCPQDITSSERNNCLFIADWVVGDNRLLCVRNTGELLWIISITPGSVVRLWLTVGNNEELLVSCEDKLLLFKTDGQFIRTIKLLNERFAEHSLKINDNRFIVSDGYHCLYVFNINNKGEILAEYDNTTTGSLNHPRHLTIITVNNEHRLLIADSGNNRIISTSLSLSDSKVFIKDQLDRPQRLWFDVKTKQLFIGCNNGTVWIYKII